MKLTNVLKVALSALVICVGVASLGCSGDSDAESASEYQLATVTLGSLTVDISASGNLALSVMEDLAFEMAGTVEEVMVEEGDSVTEGQVMAKLDTSEWEDEIASLEMALLEAEINLENAELALEEAEEGTTTTSTGDIATTATTDEKEIEILELKVQKAEYSYEKAKEALEEALAASPEVIAPFDGFVTAVNVEGGDEITRGTIAATVADPDKFEADIYVSELDITDVEVGSSATVEVDALDITVSAEVTYISSTATISSGVVNYTVTVELDPLDSLLETATTMPEVPSGEIPEDTAGFPGTEDMTEEELAAMMEQMQEQMTQAQAEQAAALEDIQLREGMTVTVSLIIAERTDVLLVPVEAILTTGGQTYVQVMLDDGTIEDRTVTVGVSSWQYSEITDGLSEGEQVVLPEGSTTTTTTEDEMFPGGMMNGGGMPMGGGDMSMGGGGPPQ